MFVCKKAYVRGAVSVLIAVILLFNCVCPVHALPSGPSTAPAVSAQSAIMIEAQTGTVILQKEADRRLPMASTTKIMTALVVCERCNVLDRVRIPAEAVGVEGSSLYLREGEVLTVQELLYGLMLHSGNDAATALAIYCGGTVEGFAELMNDKARELGLDNTHFANPHGLDAPDHHSTARDLAVLAAYAMDNPIFRQTVSTKTVTAGERSLRNHNKLLWQVDGAEGVKTGYTRAAGRILVSSASRDGRRLVAVTINAPDDWNDHRALLEDGFSHYTLQTLVTAGETVGTWEVLGGESGAVELIAAEDFTHPVADGEIISVVPQGTGFSYAPVVEGGDAGWAWIRIDGKAVGKIPLYYGKTVEQIPEEERSFWEKLFEGD